MTITADKITRIIHKNTHSQGERFGAWGYETTWVDAPKASKQIMALIKAERGCAAGDNNK